MEFKLNPLYGFIYRRVSVISRRIVHTQCTPQRSLVTIQVSTSHALQNEIKPFDVLNKRYHLSFDKWRAHIKLPTVGRSPGKSAVNEQGKKEHIILYMFFFRLQIKRACLERIFYRTGNRQQRQAQSNTLMMNSGNNLNVCVD